MVPPKIRAIAIERQDVFPKDEENVWFFRLANRLHIRTREAVVRRELLLKEGDRFDSALAAESERNLRGLGVFGSVTITRYVVSDSLVDLLVETTDQWTTEASLSFGGGGGAYKFSIGAEERNLLGWGQKLELAYEQSDLRTSRRASFYDRKFLSKPFSLSLAGEDRSDGNYYLIETGHPLYSSRERWGVSLGLFSSSDRLRFFDGGQERFYFRQKTRQAALSAARSWGQEWKTNALLAGTITQNELSGPFYITPADSAYTPAGFGFVPPEERVHSVTFAVSGYANRFSKERYLDNFGNVEDVRNGPSVYIEYVLAPVFLGSSRTRHEAAFSVGTAQKVGSHFVRLQIGNRTTFLSRRWEGTFWQGAARIYRRWGERQTTAFRLDLASISGVSRYGQFLLGAESGLRGFEARQFSGSRMILGTLEQRLFGPTVLSLFGVGGVLFADFGDVQKSGEDFRLRDLKSDWGAGLRLGLVKSPDFKVLRFDWARPFGPGGWVFSFGTQMSFTFE